MVLRNGNLMLKRGLGMYEKKHTLTDSVHYLFLFFWNAVKPVLKINCYKGTY